MAKTYSGIPIESSPEYGGDRVLLMRQNGTSKSFHIKADNSHLNLEEGYYEIEWEIQEIKRPDGKLKRCSCVTKIVNHNPDVALDNDPGDIDYELDDGGDIEFNDQEDSYDLLEGDGNACVVVSIRLPSDRAEELTYLLWRSSKDETGPYAFNEELQNTEVDIYAVYNEVSPGLGDKFRTLADSTPPWKCENTNTKDTLQFVQAETVGNDISSLMWILDDIEKIKDFRENIERIFIEAGVEVTTTE